MKYSFQKASSVKDCCKQDENIEEIRERPDLLVCKCRICGCKHRILTVDPGQLGVVMTK